VWQRAKDAGHLTDALKAELTPIGEALSRRPAGAGLPAVRQRRWVTRTTLWMQIVAKCPDGWTTPYLEQDFTEYSRWSRPAGRPRGRRTAAGTWRRTCRSLKRRCTVSGFAAIESHAPLALLPGGAR
jgi:hypothetical protein